ncbi:MAG TPA: hypothetical protein VJO52_16470 [Gemmatimonadaceae bacterium]|nr:hypothetical protein [Gemmatimonadaceae bacterium]
MNRTRGFVAGVSFLFAVHVPALKHVTGVIYLSPKTSRVGGQLGVRGAKLEKHAELKLVLRGALDAYPLGTVRTDTAGAFLTRLTLPARAGAGAYTVVAIADDGDVTARADLVIVAATGPATREAGGMPTGQMNQGPQATERMMPLRVDTTLGERATITAVIVLSALGGALLLRRSVGAGHGAGAATLGRRR